MERAGIKKRQAKATSAQVDYMVDYFVQYPHVATGKFKSLHGNAELRGSWEQLVENLNRMAKDGKIKDVKSWKSTWRDNKTAVSQKVAKIRANRAATGNVGGPPLKLTEREQKILGIMGFDYVEGVQCPDAFPEEQPEAMELLCQGQEEILETIPVTFTIRNTEDKNNTIHFIETEEDGINISETPSQIVHLETRDPLGESRESPTGQSQTEETQEGESQATESHASISQTSNRIQKLARVTKQGRERLGTQLQNARNDFVILADRQITCMEMFAKAMDKIVENDKERNAILRVLAENEKARQHIYLDLTVIIKDCVEALSLKRC